MLTAILIATSAFALPATVEPTLALHPKRPVLAAKGVVAARTHGEEAEGAALEPRAPACFPHPTKNATCRHALARANASAQPAVRYADAGEARLQAD
ncbi:hypothetical protein [Novosphingobium organovorum]|nr:hypothetical protein [Novosphingobium organovorum]